MDPLTHTLLGASLGYVTFGRRLGRTAAAVGGLAAFVPDADVFIRGATDPLLAIEYHRHFTHSLVFAPVGAAVIAALWLWQKTHRTHWLPLYACALSAYFSHCLLDAATSYGTQLFWPFTRHRFGWDFISVIDLLVTLPLAIGLTWSLLRRRFRPALVALTVAFAYLGFGVVQHARANAAQRTLAAARGHTLERHEVMPTMANNLVWRALYAHEGRLYSDRIRVGWFSAATVRPGWSLPLIGLDDLTPHEKSRNTRHAFERFAWFSEHWIARSPDDPDVLGDMRYSLSADAFDPIWGIRFTADDEPIEVAWVNRTRDRKISPAELWSEIAGHDPRFIPVTEAGSASSP